MDNQLIYTKPSSEGIDSRLIMNVINDAEMNSCEIHGLMILKHGKLLFEAYNEPYRREISHIMHSFTKCLTNTAVGLAYTMGVLELKDPVLKYFPEYAKDANEYLQKVTLHNLITMRSGQERSIGGNEWRPLKTSWLKEYFQVPFVFEPGSKYMYSSGNSYILSAIVQKVTGVSCRELIEQKLRKKIGLSDFTWSESPEGICSGGNGVSLTVEDMARIGQLYLQKGKWDGDQLLSEQWIDYAFGYLDAVERTPEEPEYNFHWEHTGDIWSAKGMFGQTCAVIPNLDMVIALTAADQNDSFVQSIQKKLIDPLNSENYVCDEKYDMVLKEKGLRMTLEDKNISVANHFLPGKTHYYFKLDGSIDTITDVNLTLLKNELIFEMTDQKGHHTVHAGMDSWIHGVTSMTGAYLHHQYEVDDAKISACAFWQDEKTLMMEWRYPEMAFCDYVSITWYAQEIVFKRWVNMNSQDLSRPELRLQI